MEKNTINLSWGMKFLLIMILIYIIWLFLNKSFILSSFESTIQSFIDITPMLVFVFSLIFVINIFLKQETIKKHLWHNSGIKWWFYTVLASIFISGNPYIMWPMLKEFKENWMKYSLIAVLMNNRNVQVTFVPVMIYYFWLKYTIIISLYILLFAVINGIIIENIMDKKIDNK